MHIIFFLLIGLLAGWLAGKIMKGKGFGLVGNLIVGIVGALLADFFFNCSASVRQVGLALSLWP